VSDENEKLIEDTFITKLGAKYPFVKAKGCNQKYGIKFFPSVFCIDATGVVHSVPDDHMPSAGEIEQMLQAVSLVPKMPADSRYDPIRTMWEKHEYAKLRDYLDKMLAAPNLDAEMQGVFDSQKQELQKRGDAQNKRAAKLGQGPDYLASSEQLGRIEKDWKGFAAADAAKQELAKFASDAAIKKELTASKALAKLQGSFDPSKISQAKKLVVELEKFVKKYEGTFAATQAAEQLKDLNKG
jgi:hypothetical protein